MAGKKDGWNLNIGQIIVNFSSLQENFMETKKRVKVNAEENTNWENSEFIQLFFSMITNSFLFP